MAGQRRGEHDPDPLEPIDLDEPGIRSATTRTHRLRRAATPRSTVVGLVVVVGIATAVFGLTYIDRGRSRATPPSRVPSSTPVEMTAVPTTSPTVSLGRVAQGCVVFARGAPDGGLHVLGADGVPRRITTTAGDWAPSWSPDGTQIVFERDHGDSELYVVDASGDTLRRLTDGRNDGDPNWSADRSRIVFQRAAPGRIDFYAVTPAGTLRLLATGEPNDATPVLSPDRSRIAFVGADPHTTQALFVMHTDGTQRAQVTHGIDAAWPRWSPDGTTIAFVNEADGSLYTIKHDGSGMRRVFDVRTLPIDTAANFTLPAWSPDSAKLVFAAGNPNASYVYTVGLAGDELTQLTSGNVTDETPSWSATSCQETRRTRSFGDAADRHLVGALG